MNAATARRLPPVISDLDRTITRTVGSVLLARQLQRSDDNRVLRAMALMEPLHDTGRPLLSRETVRAYIAVRTSRGSTVTYYPDGYEQVFLSKGPTRVMDCAEWALYSASGQLRITGTQFKAIRDAWLAGLTYGQLRQAQANAANEIHDGVAEFGQWYRSLGGVVAIATNTWNHIAKAVAETIGAQPTVGDEPVFLEGTFTGQVAYVGEKWRAALAACEVSAQEIDHSVYVQKSASRTPPLGMRRSGLETLSRAAGRQSSHLLEAGWRGCGTVDFQQSEPLFIGIDDDPANLRRIRDLGGFPICINASSRDARAARTASQTAELTGTRFAVADDWRHVQLLVEERLGI